ncbi:hypothetical protein PC123_g6933 [Phytophthora cactorum]|nr:hypothetical protein PC123_g6933 [Phytophthora cactorum]
MAGQQSCLSGGSVELDRAVRREKLTGDQAEVACPRVLKDYQTLMGGVDVHDQLRLHRYSLQLAIKYKKYYKSLFLGLVDLAVINACIVCNARRIAGGMRTGKHVKFLKQLDHELCQLREEDWKVLVSTETTTTTPSKRRSRPQRSGHNRGTDDVRGGDSSVYCSDCKLLTSSKRPKAWRVFLCDKARRTHNGIPITWFDLWYQVWRNGTMLPQSARKRKVRAHKLAEAVQDEGAEEGSAPSSDESSAGNESSDESTVGGQHQPKRARTVEFADEAFVAVFGMFFSI